MLCIYCIFSLKNIHVYLENLNKMETEHRMEQEELNKLIDEAIAAKENSYSPYSKFRVGCALLATDGRIFKGTFFQFTFIFY